MKKICLGIVVLLASTLLHAQVIKSTTFGKGINFMAGDSSMTMKFHFRMQSLFEGKYDVEGDSWSSQYLMRRSRLKFSGYAFSPKLKYKTELGLSNRDVSTSKEDGNTSGAARIILDAVLKYQFAKSWAVWVGQTKLPGNRERVVSSANLQFVDRSLVNSKFNIDRDVGIQLHGKYKLGDNFLVKPKFAWTMGEGRNITAGNQGGYNYTARLELLPLGSFKKKGDYVLADIYREESPKVAIGVTYNLNADAVRQQGQLGSFVNDLVADSTGGTYAENDLGSLQIDLIFKYSGFSVLTEYANTTASNDIAGLSKNYNTGSGLNIQAGYVLPSNWELAYRFTTIKPDDTAFSALSELNEHTLAISRYVVGHSLKVQSDVSLTEDVPTGDQTIRFRFQTEMQF